MASHQDFLFELGTEELPPKALQQLVQALAAGICDGLKKAELDFGEVKLFATPRRLAVQIAQVQVQQATRQVERRGPALKAAFGEDGLPSKAADGFAKSCGVEVADLEKLETDKGAWLVFRAEEPGQAARALLPEMVTQSLDKLPIPKRMRWGDREHQFVRPVHWSVMLLGSEVVDAEILGHKSDRISYGHRFHHPAPLSIASANDYAPLLETEGHIMPDFAERRSAIRAQIESCALELGGKAVIDEALLDEVTALVEWPQAVAGEFDRRFLAVAPEVLVSAMKGHQKYFHIVDKDEQLMPFFITIANIASSNPDAVKAGNERVIRPRLTDAEFFWLQDQKKSLGSRVEKLAKVVFQQKLGSVFDKIQRVQKLTGIIAEHIGGDRALAERAAELCKADLLTDMVGEFPELQGLMGQYYARHDGESEEVAQAIVEHYLPRFGGDVLPASKTGQALALADRLDTLLGIFGIGQPPSGAKDPFALRRAALGVQRIIIENRLALDLHALLQQAHALFKVELQADSVDQVFQFTMERLRAYYQDQGISADVFESVLLVQPRSPFDFDQRVRAVQRFTSSESSAALAAANKRIGNILKKLDQAPVGNVDEKLLSEKEEQLLFAQLASLEADLDGKLAQQNYGDALSLLAGLRESVDAFFDQVMVMAEDEKVKQNRLLLLSRLRNAFLSIADISRIAEIQ